MFKALDVGVDIIAPEGAAPLATRLDNLLEVPRAAKEWAEAKRQGAG